LYCIKGNLIPEYLLSNWEKVPTKVYIDFIDSGQLCKVK
jgi:hypothetical protein